MKDKPIIMSAESVRPIFEGRKTQTRRMVSNLDNFGLEFTHVMNVSENDKVAPLYEFSAFGMTSRQCYKGAKLDVQIRSPYQIGQRLWVRETWGIGCRPHTYSGWVDGVEYKADELFIDDKISLPLNVIDDRDLSKYESDGWQSPIFMPRWASRLTLEVVGIRCERLQDITEKDAVAEGITERYIAKGGAFTRVSKILHEHGEVGTLRNGYAVEWTNLNAKRGYPWDSNPWVWVISFKVVK